MNQIRSGDEFKAIKDFRDKRIGHVETNFKADNDLQIKEFLELIIKVLKILRWSLFNSKESISLNSFESIGVELCKPFIEKQN